MKPTAVFLALALTAGSLPAEDESDRRMPGIVKRAAETVEVLSVTVPPTGECFPDPSARVRMVDGVVMLSDLARYRRLAPDLSEGLVAFEKDGAWGACDREGRVVLAPRFESSFTFRSGLAGVVRDGKYGFIDRAGRWVIEPRFDADLRWNFVGKVCAVQVGGKNAVINRRGRYVWEPGLRRAEELAGGIFIETTSGRSGFLDDHGALIPNGQPNRSVFPGQ